MKKMILVAAAILGTTNLSNAQHVHFSFAVNAGPATVVVSSDPVPAPVPVVASPMLVTAPLYEASFVDLVTALALNTAQAMLFEPVYRSYCHDVYYASDPLAIRSLYYDRFRPYLTPGQIEMVWGHPVAYHHYGYASPVFHFEPGWYYTHHGYKSHYGSAPRHNAAPAPHHSASAPAHHPNQGYRSGNGYHQGNAGRNPSSGNGNRSDNHATPSGNQPSGNVTHPSNSGNHSGASNPSQPRFTTPARSASASGSNRSVSASSKGSSRGTFGGRTSGRQATSNTRSR